MQGSAFLKDINGYRRFAPRCGRAAPLRAAQRAHVWIGAQIDTRHNFTYGYWIRDRGAAPHGAIASGFAFVVTAESMRTPYLSTHFNGGTLCNATATKRIDPSPSLLDINSAIDSQLQQGELT